MALVSLFFRSANRLQGYTELYSPYDLSLFSLLGKAEEEIGVGVRYRCPHLPQLQDWLGLGGEVSSGVFLDTPPRPIPILLKVMTLSLIPPPPTQVSPEAVEGEDTWTYSPPQPKSVLKLWKVKTSELNPLSFPLSNPSLTHYRANGLKSNGLYSSIVPASYS